VTAPDTVTVHPLLTAEDVARVLNVGERTVWRLVSRARAGEYRFPIPIRIGPQVARWRWEDIEEYLHESRQK
jgi:predicted DNA-binding transcriptional regulator AlpA